VLLLTRLDVVLLVWLEVVLALEALPPSLLVLLLDVALIALLLDRVALERLLA
jgi:hypothetical protein